MKLKKVFKLVLFLTLSHAICIPVHQKRVNAREINVHVHVSTTRLSDHYK